MTKIVEVHATRKVIISDETNQRTAVLELGGVTTLTAPEVKALYESNPDTNAFTDGDKVKVADLPVEAREFPTRAAAAAATIRSDVTYVWTAGFAAPGDGGHALYKRVSTAPSHPLKFQSVDGAWWEFAEQEVKAEQAGMQIGGSSAGNAQGIADAIAWISGKGGGRLRLGPGRYKLDASTVASVAGIEIIGANRNTTILDYADAVNTQGLQLDGNIAYFRLEGFQVQNADLVGIRITDTNGNPSRAEIRNVASKFNGQAGFYFEGLFLVELAGCHAQGNGGYGFNFAGYHTTINAENSQAIGNANGGWRVFNTTYSSFDACAADQNTGHGWELEQVVAAFNGCGAESNGGSGFRCLGSAGSIVTGVRASMDGCFAYNNDSGGTGGNFLTVDASAATVVLGLRACADTGAVGGRSLNVTGVNAITFLEGCKWAGTKSLAGTYVENQVGDLIIGKSTPQIQLVDGADTMRAIVSGGVGYLQGPNGRLYLSALYGQDLTELKARVNGAYRDILHTENGATKQQIDDADAGRSITSFGAAGDGVADDKAAFDAAEAAGVSPVMLPSGIYRVSAQHAANISYRLRSDASVVMDTGTWNPRRWFREGVTPYARKLNPSAQNPAGVDGAYTVLEDAPSFYDYWINQWGYQQTDVSGNLSGGGLGRTQAAQLYLKGSHAGEGDGYNVYATQSVSQHGRTGIVTAWGGQNSGGLFNGQANAATAQVNLFGAGDLVLSDQGYADVAMLGHVLYLDRDGADTATYKVPRFGFMANSRGSLDADAGYIVRGKFYSGMDFAGATLSSAFAIALAADQRIAFDAGTPDAAGGKFHSEAPGGYWIYKNGSALKLVANNVAIGQFYSDRLEMRPGVDAAYGVRAFGSNVSTFAGLGQVGLVSYLSAGSTGSDNTTLALRTAAAGTEVDRLVIESAGHVRPGADNVQALGTSGVRWSNVYAAKVTLLADPTAALEAATKQYADLKLPLAGGTLTGTLTGQTIISANGNLVSRQATGNRHLWFKDGADAEVAVIWHNDADYSFRMRHKDGLGATLNELRLGPAVDEFVLNGKSILHAGGGQTIGGQLTLNIGANDANAFKIFGSSATAHLSMGMYNAIAYVAAASTNTTDDTILVLRTALDGAEMDRLVIQADGTVRPGTANTLALGSLSYPWAAVVSTSYRDVNNFQVVGARRAGWAAATGTATRTTFDTASVTLTALAERVKALLDDLTTHGLIGA